MPNEYMDQAATAKHLENIVAAWKEDPLTEREKLVLAKDSGEKIGCFHIYLDRETESAMVGWLLLKKEWARATPRRSQKH